LHYTSCYDVLEANKINDDGGDDDCRSISSRRSWCGVVGPSSVRVEVEPGVLRAGSPANLTCVAAESNPAPRVSWWRTSRDGRLVPGLDGVEVGEWRTAGEHGGVVVVGRVELALSADDDLLTVACLANGTVTATSPRLQLRVLCKSLVSATSPTRLSTEAVHSRLEGQSETANFRQ